MQLLGNVLFTIENNKKNVAKFSTISEILRFIDSGNPAKQVSINILEAEKGSKSGLDPFDYNHRHRVHARAIKGLQKVLSIHSIQAQRAFKMYYFTNKNKTKRELAAFFRVSASTMGRWFNSILTDLEREYIERQLLPKPEKVEKTGSLN